ncbi:hypothetical protein PFLCHA0_c16850 [Pseudomonas protegens CHA0]|uniref:Uncharacterized protein n=1 Tax=Pseudomonas protegens (strain DSM 19095 / LMG 27888 / CFBP 6595 / CHA0) TaxID=1124983 RepID=A0A2C9EII8_PSEPH|nr:hypothetical protein PFLCHA0_c16850 [Pseudomonas protegens CHA0]
MPDLSERQGSTAKGNAAKGNLGCKLLQLHREDQCRGR